MSDFLDRARDLFASGKVEGGEASSFSRVLKAIGKLQAVHSKALLDHTNIESVFSAFEMAALLDRLPGLSAAEVAALSGDLRTVIATTLRLSLPVQLSPNDHVLCPSGYGKLCQWITWLREKAQPRCEVTVLTFNYDLAADVGLAVSSLPVSYCLDDDEPEAGAMPLLKLHGSIAWWSCTVCRKIFAQDFSRFLRIRGYANRTAPIPDTPVDKRLRCGCANSTAERMLIPPALSKSDLHARISPVWRAAGGALSRASDVVVIGYSLPPTDEFFRLLYAVGTVGDEPFRSFTVVDPEPSVETRFRTLLGPGALASFHAEKRPFPDGLGHLMEVFRGHP
jgi:hypothetical protein